MKQIYKSKIGWWYILTCVVLTLAFFAVIFVCMDSILLLILEFVVMGSCLFLVFDVLLHTDYTIDGDKLFIRCGFIYRLTIPISKINEISYRPTIFSSPALSMKRIGIKYGSKRWVYVSPKDQEEFISALQALNPHIRIS